MAVFTNLQTSDVKNSQQLQFRGSSQILWIKELRTQTIYKNLKKQIYFNYI